MRSWRSLLKVVAMGALVTEIGEALAKTADQTRPLGATR
jgi:hypothetical protein